MKKYLLLTTLILLAACGRQEGIRQCRVQDDQAANLGKIKEIDGPVTVLLLARNNTADTLYPVQTRTQCGCTAAEPRRQPVAPGADEIFESIWIVEEDETP